MPPLIWPPLTCAMLDLPPLGDTEARVNPLATDTWARRPAGADRASPHGSPGNGLTMLSGVYSMLGPAHSPSKPAHQTTTDFLLGVRVCAERWHGHRPLEPDPGHSGGGKQ